MTQLLAAWGRSRSPPASWPVSSPSCCRRRWAEAPWSVHQQSATSSRRPCWSDSACGTQASWGVRSNGLRMHHRLEVPRTHRIRILKVKLTLVMQYQKTHVLIFPVMMPIMAADALNSSEEVVQELKMEWKECAIALCFDAINSSTLEKTERLIRPVCGSPHLSSPCFPFSSWLPEAPPAA